MTTAQPTVDLRRPHAAQMRIIAEASRFNVVDCGRRFGKTVLGIDRITGPAVLDHMPVGWFSANYKLLEEAWRDIKKEWAQVITHTDEQDHRIEVIGGGSLEMWTLHNNDNAGRGRAYKVVVIDEAAMADNLQVAWEEAIRPTLADYRGTAWFLSTPKGYNYFHELFVRGQDENEPAWASWQMPSAVNPHLAAQEIADAKWELRDRPAKFRQEWEASFQAMADARFDLEVVEEALVPGACRPPLSVVNLPFQLPGELRQYLRVWAMPRPGVPYVLGIDGAEGKGRDYTVTVVLEARTLRHVATFRENVLEPAEHGAVSAQLAKWYNDAWCMVERSHGEAILVQLSLAGCRVYHHDRRQREDGTFTDGTPGMPVTGQTRTGLIDDLAECIHDRSLTSDDTVFWGECRTFVYNDAGRPEAQPGAHDDCPSATWLAVRMARQPGAQTIRPTAGTPVTAKVRYGGM